jgi:hypothetical protein
MGTDNHVVSHKLCGFLGRVGGHVVVMKEPVVVAQKFVALLSRIFCQASENVTVKVRVDHSVRRNKFIVSSEQWPLPPPQTMSMLFVELLTSHSFFAHGNSRLLHWRQLLLCFWIITINPTFITCYDPRDLSLSRSSRPTFTCCYF